MSDIKTKTTPWRDVWEWQAVGYGFMSALDLMQSQNGRLVQTKVPVVVGVSNGSEDHARSGRDQWSSLERALSMCDVWSQRCSSLPHAIESSYCLAQLLYRDAASNNNRSKFSLSTTNRTTTTLQLQLQLAYATTVIRSINGLADRLRQRRKSAAPVSVLCASLGVPGWIVDLRHECSHNQLSSLPQLRLAAHTLLGFFVERYWRLLIMKRQEQHQIAMNWLYMYWKDYKKTKSHDEKDAHDNTPITAGVLPIATETPTGAITNNDETPLKTTTESSAYALVNTTVIMGSTIMRQSRSDLQLENNDDNDNYNNKIADRDNQVQDDDFATDDANDADNSDCMKYEDDEDAWMETNYFAALSDHRGNNSNKKSSAKKQSRKRRKGESPSQDMDDEQQSFKQQKQKEQRNLHQTLDTSTTPSTTTANDPTIKKFTKDGIKPNHQHDDMLKYAHLFLKQTPADVAFHVALLFFIWGSKESDDDDTTYLDEEKDYDKNKYNNNMNIHNGGILFCTEEEEFECNDSDHDVIKDTNSTQVQRTNMWDPLLQLLCQAWPGFLSAFLTHCVEYQLFCHPESSSESTASTSASTCPATTGARVEPDSSSSTSTARVSTAPDAAKTATEITSNMTVTDRLNAVMKRALSDEFLQCILVTENIATTKSSNNPHHDHHVTTKTRVEDMRLQIPLKSLARRLARDCPIRQTLLQYSSITTTMTKTRCCDEGISDKDNYIANYTRNDNSTLTSAPTTKKTNIETSSNNNKRRWTLVEDWEPCCIGSLPGFAV